MRLCWRFRRRFHIGRSVLFAWLIRLLRFVRLHRSARRGSAGDWQRDAQLVHGLEPLLHLAQVGVGVVDLDDADDFQSRGHAHHAGRGHGVGRGLGLDVPRRAHGQLEEVHQPVGLPRLAGLGVFLSGFPAFLEHGHKLIEQVAQVQRLVVDGQGQQIVVARHAVEQVGQIDIDRVIALAGTRGGGHQFAPRRIRLHLGGEGQPHALDGNVQADHRALGVAQERFEHLGIQIEHLRGHRIAGFGGLDARIGHSLIQSAHDGLTMVLDVQQKRQIGLVQIGDAQLAQTLVDLCRGVGVGCVVGDDLFIQAHDGELPVVAEALDVTHLTGGGNGPGRDVG